VSEDLIVDGVRACMHVIPHLKIKVKSLQCILALKYSFLEIIFLFSFLW